MLIETIRSTQASCTLPNGTVRESIDTETMDTYSLAELVLRAKHAVRRSEQYPAIVAELIRRIALECDELEVRMIRNAADGLDRWPYPVIHAAAKDRHSEIDQ